MRIPDTHSYDFHTKVRVWFLPIAAVIMAASCTNKAEDPGDPYYQPPEIHGVYQLTVLQTQTQCNFSHNADRVINLIEAMDCLEMKLEIHDDGRLESTYTELLIAKDPQTGEYTFNCGKERHSSGTWTLVGDALILNSATFIIYGQTLVDARKPDTEPFNLLVFTRK